MPEKTATIKNWAKLLLFNVKFQRKTPRNCYTQLLLQFLGCGFEPKFQ